MRTVEHQAVIDLSAVMDPSRPSAVGHFKVSMLAAAEAGTHLKDQIAICRYKVFVNQNPISAFPL